MSKKKMLYLMHIDWNWIKQRPQYIEEGLEKYFDITIVCPRNYRLKEYKDKRNVKVFYTIPFIRRYRGVWKIDDIRRKQYINNIINKINPDIIYSTSPEYSTSIPKDYKGFVIYDCMDDMLSFNPQKHMKERVVIQEREMVSKSNIVFATSERLRQILCKRYSDKKNSIYLVRNGYDGNIVDIQPTTSQKLYTLCYFGTISHWFNFDYIKRSLDVFPDVQYILIGPIEGGTKIPSHDRIKYIPPVRHEELLDTTKSADAFIMPFQINELILSVDPVKLYEYINFGKNILSVRYKEIERFKDFVFFYDDYASFISQIKKMKEQLSTIYNNEERIKFLQKNTWEKRASSIKDYIEAHTEELQQQSDAFNS